jgi:hypothetical protein
MLTFTINFLGPVWDIPVKTENDEPGESADADQLSGESSTDSANKKRIIKEKSYGLTKFTPIQLLSSLFAEEEMRILELILEGLNIFKHVYCKQILGSNGDLLLAIENLVSRQVLTTFETKFLAMLAPIKTSRQADDFRQGRPGQ